MKRQLLTSRCFKFILNFLPNIEVVKWQLLCKYFYEVQIPRSIQSCHVRTVKHRLHLINDDHIILFDLLNLTKTMRKLKWEKAFKFHNQFGKIEPSKIANYSE